MLSWDFTHRRMVVSYRRFGTIHQSHLPGWSRGMLCVALCVPLCI